MLCPAVIGRGLETERLRGRVADLADGRGGVVVLRGEAGAGKSRLVQEVGGEVDRLLLSGRAVPVAELLDAEPTVRATADDGAHRSA